MAHDLPDHIHRNRDFWNRKAADYVDKGRANWARPEPDWGIWDVRESALRLLPAVGGLDTIELGCGTGYVSAWLARGGGAPRRRRPPGTGGPLPAPPCPPRSSPRRGPASVSSGSPSR